MDLPGSEDGAKMTSGLIQWAVGAIASGFGLVVGWAVFIGRKIGGYESQFFVLRNDLDAHRQDGRLRGAHYDEQLEKLRDNQTVMEKLIAGLPDVLMIRLEPRFSDLTRRIDEAIQRRREN